MIVVVLILEYLNNFWILIHMMIILISQGYMYDVHNIDTRIIHHRGLREAITLRLNHIIS